jgi:PIN domain nuclease of toxin-antitoxin system
MLNSKRRIQLPENLESWLAFATANVREAPITNEIVFVAHHLPLPHKDPADRFLAATAKVLGLTLVTQDPALLGLGVITTLANR